MVGSIRLNAFLASGRHEKKFDKMTGFFLSMFISLLRS